MWHGTAVPDYERFARFYDAAMDDPPRGAPGCSGASSGTCPGPASVLELGCGTGSIFAQFTAFPFLTGLDRSPEMLAVASEQGAHRPPPPG